MNRQLKERVIGAIVLVVLAVLIIPEFLSGPDNGSTVNVDLELPATAETDVRTHSFRLDQPPESPSAPVPVPLAAEEPTSTAVETEKRPVAAVRQNTVETPRPESAEPPTPVSAAALGNETGGSQDSVPAPAPPPPPAPAVVSGGWAVQLGSFSSEQNAQRLVASMKEKGYEAFIARFESEGRTLHRVRVGPTGSREDAQALARRLAAQGQNGRVVPQP